MRIFISSLISGMEAERAAAKRAIQALGHEPVMAEDFGARPDSPQVACLSELRSSDLVVLVLGERYGTPQQSGLSPTHEEFREAQGRKPILTFVRAGDPEPAQAALIEEASGWEPGLYRAGFSSPEELGGLITRAVHRLELANATAPLDPGALRDRAVELFPDQGQQWSDTTLTLAVAAGPFQTIVRPAELESASLADAIQQRLLFGAPALFDRRQGTNADIEDGTLVVSQEGRHGGRHGAQVRLWESGDLLVRIPMSPSQGDTSLPVILQEDVEQELATLLAFADWLLERVDPTQRITHVVPAVRLDGGGAMAWRTRAEHAASPRSVSASTFGMETDRDRPIVLARAVMPRAALRMNASRLTEDFMALLRRRWRLS